MSAVAKNPFTELDLQDWAQMFLKVRCEDAGIGHYECGGMIGNDVRRYLVIEDDRIEVDVTGHDSFPLATRGIYFQDDLLEVEYALEYSGMLELEDRLYAVYLVNP